MNSGMARLTTGLPIIMFCALSPQLGSDGSVNQRAARICFQSVALAVPAEHFVSGSPSGRARLVQALAQCKASAAPAARSRPAPVVLPLWTWDGVPASFVRQLITLYRYRWIEAALPFMGVEFWNGLRASLATDQRNQPAIELRGEAESQFHLIGETLLDAIETQAPGLADAISAALWTYTLADLDATDEVPSPKSLGLDSLPVPVHVYVGPERVPLVNVGVYKHQFGRSLFPQTETLGTLNGQAVQSVDSLLALRMIVATLFGRQMHGLLAEIHDQGYSQVEASDIVAVEIWLIKEGSVGHMARIAVQLRQYPQPILIVGQVGKDAGLAAQRIRFETILLRQWYDGDPRLARQRQVIKPSLSQDIRLQRDSDQGVYQVMLGTWKEGYCELHGVWVDGRLRIMAVKKWGSTAGPQAVLLSEHESDSVLREVVRLRAFYTVYGEAVAQIGVFAFNDGPFIGGLTDEDHLRLRDDGRPDIQIVSVSNAVTLPRGYVPLALALENVVMRDHAGDPRQPYEIGYWAQPHMALEAFIQGFLDRRLLGVPQSDYAAAEREAFQELQELVEETRQIVAHYPLGDVIRFSPESPDRYASILAVFRLALDGLVKQVANEVRRPQTSTPPSTRSPA